MMSVVIAVEDEEEGLARTLASLVPAVAEGVLRDAVILDSGGRESTAAIADAAGCQHVRGSPREALGRIAEQVNASWLLMLKPGVILEHDWFREAAEFVERADAQGEAARLCAAFSYASQRYGLAARMVETWRFVSANLLGRVVEDQGLILSREAVRRISGGGANTIPPRPPAGSRLVLLRAKAHAPAA
ncbi:MAG: hypothetical protein KDJ90_21630 [Nitratireductor sp.]|nr:hypothetical protein [Nitratireductor sp.]